MMQAHRPEDELTVDQEILAYARNPANWLRAFIGFLVVFALVGGLLTGPVQPY